MNATETGHRRRMLRVLAHIQENLDEALNLEALAAVAGYSPFHFHRVFLGMTGETVGAHIRRLRLARAAHRLEFAAASVTEIALEAGYEAPEAFTRAFKAQYGEAPSRFREYSRRRRGERVGQLFPFPEDFIRQQTGGEAMDVSIISKEPIRVACIRAVGPYMDSSRQAWERMVAWAGPRGLFGPRTRFIGVGQDSPGTTAPELLRYDACISVGPEVETDGEAFVTELPGGEYAAMVHKGPYEGLEKTYMWLYGVWLPGSGRVSAGRPGYEVYLNTPDRTPPEELLTEINVPLEPK